ncbi:MAG: O-acetylhomoserine aminocarboxypropyltransferase/cysteine synthase family protein [Clostridium sp.]
MSKKEKRKYEFETLQVHAGQEEVDSTGSRAVPIYQTSSFIFDDTLDAESKFNLSKVGYTYTRMNNPTQNAFEERVSALEGGVGALALASGAAAISVAIETIVTAGKHVIAANTLYGGTYNYFEHALPKIGVEATIVNPDNPENFEEAIKENTRAIFIETLGNPNSNIIDVDKVAEIAHKHGIPLIVDNTFATPYLFRPIEHGADIVVHSATKFIGGHGTSIGGIIVDGGKFDWEASGKFEELTTPNPSYHGVVFTETFKEAAYIIYARTTQLRDRGAAISPLNSFLFLQGLETLSLRVERHVENTKKVIEYLKSNPKVEKINHPSLEDSPYNELYRRYFPNGAGSVFTFEIKGGEKEAKEFIDKLQVFSQLANVADAKSLVIHPWSTTHSQLSKDELISSGIKPNTIRLSIGIENANDIIYDLKKAFED